MFYLVNQLKKTRCYLGDELATGFNIVNCIITKHNYRTDTALYVLTSQLIQNVNVKSILFFLI